VPRTPKEIRELARRSFLYWFGCFCHILDKLRNDIIPEPNIAQIRLAEAVEYCDANGIPARIIMVKPRKVGISTEAVALGYYRMRKQKQYAAIMGDTLARSDELFGTLNYIADHDDFPWNDGLTPVHTDSELRIGENEGDSIALKFTAEKPTGTRGGTPQTVVATEAAFYPSEGKKEATETMTALSNSVPKLPGTLVIIESTAKGLAGFFPKKWQDAQWPKFYPKDEQYWLKYLDGAEDGQSDYIRVFVAWWEMREYRMEVTAEEARVIQSTLTAEETKGIQAYGWTVEQLRWRRYTIINDCENNETKFKEEFPSSPDEPFTSSGSPRFDVAGMNYLQKLAQSIQWGSGVLSEIPIVATGTRPQFIPTAPNEAWLQRWEPPRVGCRYFISSDVAEDKDMNPAKGSNDVMRDMHGPFVIRDGFRDDRGVWHRPRVVGRFMPPCRWGHDLLAMRLYQTSLYYGGCPVAPEMNNHGLALARELKRLGANVFFFKTIDEVSKKEIITYGWRTTAQSRPALIEELAKSIRNVEPRRNDLDPNTLAMDPDALEILDVHAIAQLRNFVIDSSGRAAAASGKHDDDVMGIAIGYYLRKAATVYAEAVVQRRIEKFDYQVVRDRVESSGGGLPLM
jgi:hypothetical protein